MDWVLQSPQIHSTFGNLGYVQADGYHVTENCNAALEAILHNILTEDKFLRTYRRSISFGQNIKKDLIPLLIHAKEDKTIELLISILVNLTIPIECLLSMDMICKTDFGRHTIFEINNLLASTKAAFTDDRTTRVIIDYLKKNMETDQKTKLSLEQCTNISNSLLLLRNILHIPAENGGQSPSVHAIQNQILWNIFSQGIDKVLIKLMIIPDAGFCTVSSTMVWETNWGVTMVQLIALLYKDQHVVTLHKLLNFWLEAALSESSEDNESNTSPPGRGSEDSSPMLTSDPTSDSSDGNIANNEWNGSSANNTSEKGSDVTQPQSNSGTEKESEIIDKKEDRVENTGKDCSMQDNKEGEIADAKSEKTNENTNASDTGKSSTNEKKCVVSENSDCGYGTQIENQESISTSSNEDDLPTKKPVHQKPHNPKQRANNKGRTGVVSQDGKRKKLVKRGKSNILNVQGLLHKTPTDDDISNVLKEFTVDFLLKGYNSLVETLHNQILTNLKLEIDTSHFFWLVTYFLKFATQIELNLEHVCSVLSFDIVSYLTAEGVNLCEQFELAIKLDGNDLKPSIRRLHLVVTAIRELVQAIEAYKKFTHICKDEQDALVRLQMKMCETEELRSLLVLLLRHYNPKYHSKQYLQDLVVTNHILLTFLDSVMSLPEYKGSTNMLDHIKQFATTEVMHQYSILLEDYTVNGEFVNDCIFTLMHHVGGELGSLITLFQPKILKTFTSIWKSEFEICDDWSDLIEYVINTFIKKPQTLQSASSFRLETETFEDDRVFVKPTSTVTGASKTDKNENKQNSGTANDKDRWTEDEISSLSWNYIQYSSKADAVGELIKLFKEDGVTKTRDSIIKELYKQNLIDKEELERMIKTGCEKGSKTVLNKEPRDDEISKLCEQLAQDGKAKFLDWVQKVLLETCYAKICIDKKTKTTRDESTLAIDVSNTENTFMKPDDCPVTSPVSYHSLRYCQSVPLVPWNCEQASICKDLKFLQLLHRLGFHMPVDSGKVFIRIPHFWTADFLYDVAGKILPIDKSQLKFSTTDIADSSVSQAGSNALLLPKELIGDVTMIDAPENFYQVHKQTYLATMVNYTPMPGSSFIDGEPSKPNWFELVQKSQEYKMTLDLDGRLAVEDEAMRLDQDTLMEADDSPIGSRVLMMPELPSVMSVKQDASPFNIADSEFFSNSVCETASVASDLTRMYVSDEDEKPELLLCPVIDVDPMMDDANSDIETSSAKRPRVQYSPTF